MADSMGWSDDETETQLRRLFETAKTLDGGIEFMNVEFGETAPTYQFLNGWHNVTGLDEEMAASMDDVIDTYELTVVHEQQTTSGSSIAAAQGADASVDETYTVFAKICDAVYGCEPADAIDGYISPVEGTAISWRDV